MTSRLIWYPGHELFKRDIVRAEGCYLYDSRGRRYLDLEAGVWCTSIGHSNPRILRVITDQASKISHTGFGYSSPIVDEAAETILSILGFDGGSCTFLCSGSEAIEFGVRHAHAIIDRPLLMTMTDSYFGAYGSAMRKEADEWFCFDWAGCTACPDERECAEACDRWATIPFERIGGFVFEPGSSPGTVRFPPSKLIQSIARKVKTDGGLIQVNEVTTGIGRTGDWFGHRHYEIHPDIAALGKGIGNGYPVSVSAFSPGVIDRLGSKRVVYAQSHQNDPLGAAVALEVIRFIEENCLIGRSREVGGILLGGLERVMHRTGRIAEIRARGLMAAFDVADDANGEMTARIQGALVERGYFVGRRPGSQTLRLDPPLTVELDDIEGFLADLEAVLREAA
jgi:acetylornithine aminotransferase